MHDADMLINRYPIISDQVDQADVHIVLEQLERVLAAGIPGDIVEFGCYIGTTSLFIRRLLDGASENRSFHVYDSFEGLPPKNKEDDSPAGIGFRAGALSISKKQFIREFQKANLKVPVIHKGWFNDLTADDVPAHIAFAFLDGDFYQSIKDSLALVLPRMSRGGVIVIDDYAREALPGVAKAVHETGLAVQTVHGLGIIHIA